MVDVLQEIVAQHQNCLERKFAATEREEKENKQGQRARSERRVRSAILPQSQCPPRALLCYYRCFESNTLLAVPRAPFRFLFRSPSSSLELGSSSSSALLPSAASASSS